MTTLITKEYRVTVNPGIIEVYKIDECVVYEIDVQQPKLNIICHTQSSKNPLFADLLQLFNKLPMTKIKKIQDTYKWHLLENYAEETVTDITEQRIAGILYDYGFSKAHVAQILKEFGVV